MRAPPEFSLKRKGHSRFSWPCAEPTTSSTGRSTSFARVFARIPTRGPVCSTWPRLLIDTSATGRGPAMDLRNMGQLDDINVVWPESVTRDNKTCAAQIEGIEKD